MKDILLIRGGEKHHVIDALWVCADLANVFGNDTQVDIAVPEAHADYAKLSNAVRRVVGISSLEKMPALTKPPAVNAAGFKKLFSAAKNVANIAGDNLRTYRDLVGELRLVDYDMVFDFDSSGFSIAITRFLKTPAIIGFDEKNLADPLPGSALMYHTTHHIKDDKLISNSRRLRLMVAKHFDYKPHTCDCHIPRTETAILPESPYIVIDGELPEVFLQVLRESGYTLIGDGESLVDTLPATEVVELARNAAAVVGGGAITALASLVGSVTLFIGDKRDLPEGATYITTPAILADALPSKTPAASDDVVEELAQKTPDAPPVKKLTLPGH